jgi:hypothetical protein
MVSSSYFDDSTWLDTLLTRLMELVKLNEDYWVLMDDLFNFIMKIVARYENVRTWFYTHA